MTPKKWALIPLAGLALVMLQAGTATEALAAPCPAITVADDMGITGKYPQQFDLAEFEKLANCKLSFSENPSIGALNDRIVGNPSLPSLADRMPSEPLVVAPYFEIGTYGGTLDMISNALEAGTSEIISGGPRGVHAPMHKVSNGGIVSRGRDDRALDRLGSYRKQYAGRI